MIPKVRLLLVLSLIALLTNACKKDSDEPSSYVKFKKDGVWETSVGYGRIYTDPQSLFSTITIYGIPKDSSKILTINLRTDNPNILTGTFNNNSPGSLVYIVYEDKASGNTFITSNAPTMPPVKYAVTITSVTSTTITGYFTGNYLYDLFSSIPKTVNITEGEFKVTRFM